MASHKGDLSDPHEIARNLVFALRRLEADAEGVVQTGNAKKALEHLRSVRDTAGNVADDAAKKLKMPPYDTGQG